MILIAYDGSEDAKCAVRSAGELLAGQPTVILTVWEPYADVVARAPAPFGITPGIGDSDAIDATNQRQARACADQGAELGRTVGLDATSRTTAREDSVAQTILAEADRANASAIVVGSRGLGGLGSMLMGSVSHAILQHADRTVVIVPSAKVAQRRNTRRRPHADTA
jgi:nucleotide-binding universal stress UspA family protein